MAGEWLMRAHDLGQRYGTRWLFRHLDISLSAGDVLVVTGDNGAGKSTLLRLLAGIDSPAAGQLEMTSNLGYAALDLSLYSSLTPREHIDWVADMREVAPVELSGYGIAAQSELPSAALSSGQRSRLRLALAELGGPELLLLDEPGAALDESGRELLDRIVERQRDRGALVVATNDPSERRWATHELILG